MQIAVTDADGDGPDQHLARPRRVDLNLLDRSGSRTARSTAAFMTGPPRSGDQAIGSASRPRTKIIGFQRGLVELSSARRGRRRKDGSKITLPSEPCERRAEAEVDAVGEGDVPVRLPAHVEHVGIAELARVAVRRRHQRHHHLAAPDRPAAPNTTSSVATFIGRPYRAVVAQELLDRAVEERRVVAQQRRLRRVAEQMEEPVAEQVARGLVSGEEQQDAVRDHLVVRQVLALVLGADHERHEVVTRPAHALAQQRLEVVDERRDAGVRLAEVVAAVDRAADVRGETVPPRLDRVQVLLGAPMRPAITLAGSGKAKSRMKSMVPRATTRSSSASAVRWIRSPLAASCFGVKEFWRSPRRRPWSGGSRNTSQCPRTVGDRAHRRPPAGILSSIFRKRSDENASVRSKISTTSVQRVATQALRLALQCTGS